MSALAHFECVGPAAVGRVRAAGLLDALAATVIAMVAAPQPVIRQAAMQAVPGPGGIALFVVALLGAVVAVFWLYLAFTAVTWGRTPGMYLLDLGLEAPTKPTLPEAAGWAGGWVLALLPALLGIARAYDPECGLPASMGGLPTRSASSTGSGSAGDSGSE